jgi:large subunit ribosomal protein L9
MRPCTRRIVPAEDVIKATSLNDVLVEHAPWCRTAPNALTIHTKPLERTMNVILLKDVEKLGMRGEVVNVARGYARNFLLPRQLAEVATEGRVKEVKRIDAQKAMHEARSTEQAQEIAATLGKLVLTFDVKSGPTGSLFGSVTTTDIADEIWRIRKIRVDRRKIGVDNIKRIGRYTVPIDLFEGTSAEIKLLVVPEGGELPPEEELAAMEAAEVAAAAEAAGPAVDESEWEFVEEDSAGEIDDVIVIEETVEPVEPAEAVEVTGADEPEAEPAA